MKLKTMMEELERTKWSEMNDNLSHNYLEEFGTILGKIFQDGKSEGFSKKEIYEFCKLELEDFFNSK